MGLSACRVCGAVRAEGDRHKHEVPGWKPPYDDFEGTLEGYETVRSGAERPNPSPASGPKRNNGVGGRFCG